MNSRTLLIVAVALVTVLFAGFAGSAALDGPLLGSSSDSPNGSSSTTGPGTNDATASNTPAAPAATTGAGASNAGADGDGETSAAGNDDTATPDAGTPVADGGSGDTTTTGAETTATTTAEPEPASFLFTVDRVERCGRTCRDVTVTVRNQGGTAAENVDVGVRVLADGEALWTGSQSFDRIGAGESRTQTERVNLGLFGGAKVKANDGYVTIETTIEWDGGQQTFTERRQVA